MGEVERDSDSVEVVYAKPGVQRIVVLPRTEGLTAEEAVRRSGLLEAFPEIATRALVLGIFGQRVEPDRVLAEGDRVEICRPLLRDPRELRRELSSRGEVIGGRARNAGSDD